MGLWSYIGILLLVIQLLRKLQKGCSYNQFLEPTACKTILPCPQCDLFVLLLQKLVGLVCYIASCCCTKMQLQQNVFAQLLFAKRGEYLPSWENLRSDGPFSIFLFCMSKGNILCKNECIKIGGRCFGRRSDLGLECSCKLSLSGFIRNYYQHCIFYKKNLHFNQQFIQIGSL